METTSTPRLVSALRKAYDLKKGRTELEGAEAGFTLIELMVVLLIMAILLAIAIPTFLGVKTGAQDRAVQSNLTNGLTSAKAAYANGGTYAAAAAEVTALQSAEPNISFEAGVSSSGSNNLSVNTSTDGQELLLVGMSQSNTCWAAVDNEGDTTGGIAGTPSSASPGGTSNGLGVQYAHWTSGTGATCTAGTGFPTTETWATHY
jgi:type IV pilus assembly protein PilA